MITVPAAQNPPRARALRRSAHVMTIAQCEDSVRLLLEKSWKNFSIATFSSHVTMGKDYTKKQHVRKSNRTAPKSDNVYLGVLVKLYTYLARMYIEV